MTRETLTVQLFKAQAEIEALRAEIASLKGKLASTQEQCSKPVLALPGAISARREQMQAAKALAIRMGQCVRVS